MACILRTNFGRAGETQIARERCGPDSPAGVSSVEKSPLCRESRANNHDLHGPLPPAHEQIYLPLCQEGVEFDAARRSSPLMHSIGKFAVTCERSNERAPAQAACSAMDESDAPFANGAREFESVNCRQHT
jgi:hypothetical protein